MSAGRPSEYTPERGAAICELISQSDRGLDYLHEQDPATVPHRVTILRWLNEHEEFRTRYALARQEQADYIADAATKILDECEPRGGGSMPSALVAKAREQAQHRRWMAGRLAPKRWGDRVEHELGEKAAGTLSELVKSASGER